MDVITALDVLKVLNIQHLRSKCICNTKYFNSETVGIVH